MKLTKITSSILATTTVISLVAPVFVTVALAEDSANVTTNVSATANGNTVNESSTIRVRGTASSTQNQANLISKAKDRANQEIDRRIAALNKVAARIQSMVKISASEKASLNTEIQGQITTLTNLKTKITADTDLATVKTDVQSITASYRIYALIIPQIEIMAAADRLSTIADAMTTISTKLQTRITADQSAGKDVTALQASLTDFNAKIADAKVQAQAAITTTTGLTPDQGSQSQFNANKAALEHARADIKVGTQDLNTARKDAQSIIDVIIKDIRSDIQGENDHSRTTTSPSPTASPSSSPSTSPSPSTSASPSPSPTTT